MPGLCDALSRRHRLWSRMLLVLFLLGAARVEGHPAQAGAVLLDVGETRVRAELQVPLDQLGMALEGRPDAPPPPVDTAPGPALERYVTDHFGLETTDGRPYTTTLYASAFRVIDGADHLVVELILTPPPGAETAVFELRDDVILHRVVSHKIFVSVRRDFRAGRFEDRLEPVGVLMYQRDRILVSRSQGSTAHGFQSIFLLGMRHIAEGRDHLLFLLVLLLATPLLAEGNRWTTGKRPGSGVRAVIGIVTAFTIGHSLTLVCAGFGWLRLAPTPVEVAIAFSILVSAMHVVRPLFAGREYLVAAGFGLVHGLAFATFLSGFGFDRWSLAISLLGFNLGIEAMQLLVVAMVVPALLMLGRTPAYAAVRLTGALFAGVAAIAWMGERALGWTNSVAPWVDAVFSHWQVGIGLLWLLTIIARQVRTAGPTLPPAPASL